MHLPRGSPPSQTPPSIDVCIFFCSRSIAGWTNTPETLRVSVETLETRAFLRLPAGCLLHRHCLRRLCIDVTDRPQCIRPRPFSSSFAKRFEFCLKDVGDRRSSFFMIMTGSLFYFDVPLLSAARSIRPSRAIQNLLRSRDKILTGCRIPSVNWLRRDGLDIVDDSQVFGEFSVPGCVHAVFRTFRVPSVSPGAGWIRGLRHVSLYTLTYEDDHTEACPWQLEDGRSFTSCRVTVGCRSAERGVDTGKKKRYCSSTRTHAESVATTVKRTDQ